MNNRFTVEEENIICIYYEENRNRVIENIREAVPYMDEDIKNLADGVIGKLQAMTDAEFDEAQFTFTDE